MIRVGDACCSLTRLLHISPEVTNKLFLGYCPHARWGKNSFMEMSMPLKTIDFERDYHKQKQANYHLRVLKYQLRLNAQVSYHPR